MADKAGPVDDDVYEIQASETEIPNEWRSNSLYELESAARCPYCRAVIRTLRVIRLTRLQVAFTSTLPRAGRAIVCPECDRVISAEVGGLISADHGFGVIVT